MAVYLDEQQVDLAGATLGEMLEAAAHRLQSDGRIVVEVNLDGQTLSGEQLTRQTTEPVTDQQQLRLSSAEPTAVARQALEQMRGQLLDQQPVLADAATKLQQDQAAAAFSLLGKVNDVWLTAMQVIEQSAKLLAVRLADLEVEGKPFSDCTNELFGALQELRRQVQDQDSAALADALEHEWPSLISQWDAVIGTLIGLTK